MDLSTIFLCLFAGLSLSCALMTVFLRNPVSSAFSLVLTFFGFAGMYAVLGAHLIAVMQILVYTGAIMVLFVFVIMLLNADAPSADLARTPIEVIIPTALGVVFALVFLVQLFKGFPGNPANLGLQSLEAIEAAGGNTRVISRTLFSQFIFPFELVGFLLLAAIIASITLAKRTKNRTGNKHA